MHLHAASIGSAVPRENFDAVIQSVFDSAVNLRLANEDRLITLLISDHYELPQGIRLDKNALLPSLTPNLGAAARGGVLRFDLSPLTIGLRNVPIWVCRVPEIKIDITSEEVIQSWSLVWKLLNQEQRVKSTEVVADDLFKSSAGSPLSQKLGAQVLQFVYSVEKFDVQGATQAAEKMIGLGPGVTPSGDDLLIGFLAGLWSVAGGNPTQVAFIHSFGNKLLHVAEQTNEISRTYLYHAAQGQFSSSLSTLAESIATGIQVEGATRNTMRVGHSSGMDSVTGMLIGLAIWNTKNKHLPLRTFKSAW